MKEELYQRPTWDEYFLMIAKLAATRSTCLVFPVGAVIDVAVALEAVAVEVVIL